MHRASSPPIPRTGRLTPSFRTTASSVWSRPEAGNPTEDFLLAPKFT
jgi:hypothetical protein